MQGYHQWTPFDLTQSWVSQLCCVGELAAELDVTQFDVNGRLVDLADLPHEVFQVCVERLVTRRSTRQLGQVAMPPHPSMPGVVHVELGSTRHRC